VILWNDLVVGEASIAPRWSHGGLRVLVSLTTQYLASSRTILASLIFLSFTILLRSAIESMQKFLENYV
jgi:hypothetical protein